MEYPINSSLPAYRPQTHKFGVLDLDDGTEVPVVWVQARSNHSGCHVNIPYLRYAYMHGVYLLHLTNPVSNWKTYLWLPGLISSLKAKIALAEQRTLNHPGAKEFFFTIDPGEFPDIIAMAAQPSLFEGL